MDVTETYDRIVDGWERAETNNGIPYYISHKLQRTTWDHPYLIKIMEELAKHGQCYCMPLPLLPTVFYCTISLGQAERGQYSVVKYAAYRTAFKIRHLQKKLKLHQVSITAVKDIFDHYGYAEGSINVIGCTEIHDLLTNLYRSADHGSAIETEEAEIHAELLQNLILNLFDVNRTGCVKVVSMKLMLITLCAARLAEKYKAYYHELHDPSTYISTSSFTTYLQDLIQLPDLLQESGVFGVDVTPVVASCVQMCNSGTGISEDMFYSWLLREPQILVWLPTFHRTAASETVKHESKCNICKTCPIVGFRYKCLLCFNFDMCQNCFFTGRTKKNHKLKHPIQEYCLKTSPKDDTKAFFLTIRNNFSKRHRQKAKMKYLPLMSENQYCQYNWSVRAEPPTPDIHTNLTENAKRLADLEVDYGTAEQENSPPNKLQHNVPSDTENKENETLNESKDTLRKERREMEHFIRQLEEENRQLQQQLNLLKEVRESSDTESNISGGENAPRKRQNKQKHSVPKITKGKPLASLENTYPIKTNDTDLLHADYTSSVLYSSHHYRPSQPHHGDTPSPVSHPSQNTPSPRSHTSLNSASPSPRSHTSVNSATPLPHSHISLNSTTNSSSSIKSHNYGSHSKSFSPASNNVMSQYDYSSRFTPDCSPGESNFTHRASEGVVSYFAHRDGTAAFDSLDNLDVSPSHFTLPSFANSRAYVDEEEMDQLVNRMDKIFPSNLSYSAYSMSNTGTMTDHEEMLQAASTMGTAMSDFVNEAIHPYYQY